MGHSSPCNVRCVKTAPKQYEELSVARTKGSLES